jgi:predicted regulator of Ras-like GTPase activity (Roadblock/LC7/MglB family)
MTDEHMEDLRGSLAFTTLTDVLQFLHTTERTGMLRIEGGPDASHAQVYFEHGNVYHAQQGELVGIDAMVEIITWVEGTFRFSADSMVPTVSIEVPLPSTLVEAARRLDEQRRSESEGENRDAPQQLLDSFAETAEIAAALLMARNGHSVVAANPDEAVDMEVFNGCLIPLIDSVETLGSAQGCEPFAGFFIEYDRFLVFCLGVADATLVVVASGRAQLGVIRHKTRQLAESLAKVLPG